MYRAHDGISTNFNPSISQFHPTTHLSADGKSGKNPSACKTLIPILNFDCLIIFPDDPKMHPQQNGCELIRNKIPIETYEFLAGGSRTFPTNSIFATAKFVSRKHRREHRRSNFSWHDPRPIILYYFINCCTSCISRHSFPGIFIHGLLINRSV